MSTLYKSTIWLFLFTTLQLTLLGQEEKKEVVIKPLISLQYFNVQNQSQYLTLQCQLKEGKKVSPITKLGTKIYLDDETIEENLIGKFTTNEEGKVTTTIPTTFKEKWLKTNHHKFIAVTDSIRGIGEREAEAEITIARMMLDTVADAESRTVSVKFEEKKENKWIPVKDVEIKLGIERLGSILSVGEGETVTTDSTGTASVEFTRDSLPGDSKGNLNLVARVEDNDVYGNLEVQKSVPWGEIMKRESIFKGRSLWATGDKVPLWLLAVALFIICSVWGTLIYLVFKFIKVRKLGTIVKS